MSRVKVILKAGRQTKSILFVLSFPNGKKFAHFVSSDGLALLNSGMIMYLNWKHGGK